MLENDKIDSATLIGSADLIDKTADSIYDRELTTNLLSAALKDKITNEELMLALLIIENEILSRGGYTYIPGILPRQFLLSKRTKTLLKTVSSGLRTVATR